VLLGKLLRIDVNSSTTPPFYISPSTNPYFGVTTPDTLDQIYAFGLRNPFRWNFDRLTHDLWIGDVGQGAWEEIDFIPADSAAGLNFGWSCYEGTAAYNPALCAPSLSLMPPIFTYPNPGGAAVDGGVVYRGTLPANAPLVGYFLANDYYSGNFYKIKPNGSGGWTVFQQNGLKAGVPNIGEAENGEVYVVSQYTGDISHITIDAVLPARLEAFTAIQAGDGVQLKWQTVFEENLSRFEIEYSTDGANFRHAGYVAALNLASGANYSFDHPVSYSGRLYYRLKMINIDNSAEFSGIVSVEMGIVAKNFIRPSIITTGVINVYPGQPYQTFELISMKGEIVLKQHVEGQNARIDIPVKFLAPGSYIARLSGNGPTVQQKVILR
jgi:hypothetical protein